MDLFNTLADLFGRLVDPYHYDENDIKRITHMCELLKNYHLEKLVNRFTSDNKINNFVSTFTEIITTSKLIEIHPDSVIKYEPYNGIPDIAVNLNGVDYNIQFKRESNSEKDNRLINQLDQITHELGKINTPVYFDLQMPKFLPNNRVVDLINFIKEKSNNFKENEKYLFEINGEIVAAVCFYKSLNPLYLTNITLGSWQEFIDDKVDIECESLIFCNFSNSDMKDLKIILKKAAGFSKNYPDLVEKIEKLLDHKEALFGQKEAKLVSELLCENNRKDLSTKLILDKIDQLKQSLFRAAKNLTMLQDQNSLNLIVIENSNDIDLGMACFGEEICGGHGFMGRDIASGFFHNCFSISAIVGIKKYRSYIQSKTCFINPNCTQYADKVISLFLPDNTYFGNEEI